MVVPTDFNLQNLRARTFKGFVQFQDPANPGTFLRLKERQTMRLNFQFNRETHYSDTGKKAVDPMGFNHTFSIDLKLTADMFDDDFSASSDQKTLSFWIFKNQEYEPIEVIFVTTIEALSGPAGDTGDKFIHLKFVLDPNVFGAIQFGATGGSVNMAVSGDILSIETVTRTANNEAP